MKKILFPTDFSALSLDAFDYATHFVEALDINEITVLHVYEIPLLTTSGKLEDVISQEAKVIRNSKINQLEKFVSNYKKLSRAEGLSKITYNLEERTGLAADTIKQFAQDGHFDLIIMGTSGIYGHLQNIDDIVTCNIIHDAGIPVLAIPEDFFYTPPIKILVAISFERKNTKMIETVKNIAGIFKAEIHLFHIVLEDQSAKEKDIKSLKENLNPLKSFDFVYQSITGDDVVQDIIQFAAHEKMDLIVTNHRQMNEAKDAVDNVTELLCSFTEIPVLALIE